MQPYINMIFVIYKLVDCRLKKQLTIQSYTVHVFVSSVLGSYLQTPADQSFTEYRLHGGFKERVVLQLAHHRDNVLFECVSSIPSIAIIVRGNQLSKLFEYVLRKL